MMSETAVQLSQDMVSKGVAHVWGNNSQNKAVPIEINAKIHQKNYITFPLLQSSCESMQTELESNKISLSGTQVPKTRPSLIIFIHNLFSSFQVACQRIIHNMKPPLCLQKVLYVFLILENSTEQK